MNSPDFGRALVVAGLGLAAIGAYLALGGRVPSFGRLPGDIYLQRGGITIWIPITTMVLVSVAVTLPYGRWFGQKSYLVSV